MPDCLLVALEREDGFRKSLLAGELNHWSFSNTTSFHFEMLFGGLPFWNGFSEIQTGSQRKPCLRPQKTAQIESAPSIGALLLVFQGP